MCTVQFFRTSSIFFYIYLSESFNYFNLELRIHMSHPLKKGENKNKIKHLQIRGLFKTTRFPLPDIHLKSEVPSDCYPFLSLSLKLETFFNFAFWVGFKICVRKLFHHFFFFSFLLFMCFLITSCS